MDIMTEKGLRNIVVLMGAVALFSNSVVLFRLHQTIMEMSIANYCLDVVLALAFSCLSAYAVRNLGFCKDTIRFAAFDGVAILLHFLTFIPNLAFNIIAALFFALQFFWQVLMIAKLSDRLRDEKKPKAAEPAETKPAVYIRRINAMGSSKKTEEENAERRKQFIMSECPPEMQEALLEKYNLNI